MIRSIYICGIAALLTAVAAHAGTAQRRYPLPGHGSFELAVPVDWADKVHQPEGGEPPTILFGPKSGRRFKISVTPMFPDVFTLEPPDAEMLHQHVEAMAVRAGERSVEKNPPLHEVKGSEGMGYYFSVTAGAPAPNGFKYMTQGVLGVGTLVVAFTVLSNDPDRHVAEQALDMLRGARHLKSRAKPGPRENAPRGGQ